MPSKACCVCFLQSFNGSRARTFAALRSCAALAAAPAGGLSCSLDTAFSDAQPTHLANACSGGGDRLELQECQWKYDTYFLRCCASSLPVFPRHVHRCECEYFRAGCKMVTSWVSARVAWLHYSAQFLSRSPRPGPVSTRQCSAPRIPPDEL